MDIGLLLRGESLNQVLGRLLPEDRLLRELLSSLRPGQTLQAQVLASPRPDIARLLIQDVPLTASTGRPLTPGQTLTLTVLEGGETPQLRVQDPQRPPSGQDVLRIALPRQMPLAESLGGLAQIAARVLPLLKGPGREALLGLLDQATPLRQLSSSNLRQAVQDSGLFTEARLAAGQAPTRADRKMLLLQLAAALPPRPTLPTTPTAGTSGAAAAALSRATLASAGPNPPLDRATLLGQILATIHEPTGTSTQANASPAAQNADQQMLERLWRLVDASLARIQTHQAASLPGDDQGSKVWQLEIPLTLPGMPPQAVELRIEPEESALEGSDTESGWLVNIGFVFPELGPVKAGVRLAGGRISTTFWCEHAIAVRRFEAHLPQLHDALEAVGLEVSHLAASQGQPPRSSAEQPRQRLLDERV